MRVLVVHNRYRLEGGEERSVELQLEALRRAGVEHALLERSSDEVSRPAAARALLRGGRDEDDVRAAAESLNADVVHAHNTLPLFGPRALEAARAAGAAVVMHLHNLRLFCAIGVAARDGGPCFRCHHRNTLPGLLLNCRGSLPEAAVYATALARHQPATFRSRRPLRHAESTTRPGNPRCWAFRRRRSTSSPTTSQTRRSPRRAAPPTAGTRSSRHGSARRRESTSAIEAAALADIPLRVAGEGPAAAELIELANVIGAPVDFIGRLGPRRLERELRGAAMLLMPSRYHEFAGLLGTRGDGRGRARHRARGSALCRSSWARSAASRRTTRTPSPRGCGSSGASRSGAASEGEALIARAREDHSEERYVERLLDVYSARAPVGDRVGDGLLERDLRPPAARRGEPLRRAAHLGNVVGADALRVDVVARSPRRPPARPAPRARARSSPRRCRRCRRPPAARSPRRTRGPCRARR